MTCSIRELPILGVACPKVAGDFIPGEETINDGSVKLSCQVRPEWSHASSVQYKKWFAPILAPAAQTNWTSSKFNLPLIRGAGR